MPEITSVDQIPGVGEKRRRNLMKHFGSIEKIKAASVDELVKVPTITHGVAEQMKKYFDRNK